jgi:hypothetical protein
MKATILFAGESGSRIGRSQCPLREDPAGNNRLLDIACFSIEALLHSRWAKVTHEEPPSFGIGMHSLSDSRLVRRCLIFEGELFGHKWVCAQKSDTATAQFLEEYDPRSIGERNIRQLKRQLNLLGDSVNIACSPELLDRGTRYPTFDPKGYGISRRFDNRDPQHRDSLISCGLDKAIDMPFTKSGRV